MTLPGRVYIASMNLRGKWADPINPNSLKLNVTSAQAKNNANRLDFSPMTPVPNGYKGYWNFESYWQAGKVYENMDNAKIKGWWLENKAAKRRYPGSKGKKVLYAEFEAFPGQKLDYISSRKLVYVPEYYNLIKNRGQVKYWKKLLAQGHDITIYDFDGPRLADGSVTCLELTLETLIDKINDPAFPFGHGYIVAATLLDILPEAYQ